MDQLHDIRAFVEVARCGSFVRAGELLRQSNSAVSKAVSRLETRLDVRLFQRTTRHLALTEEGRGYFEDCLRVLGELERADDAVMQRKGEPHGQLKIHLPLLWAREVIVPALPDFQQRYPHISLQLVFSEVSVDFRDGYDLSVQLERVLDENLVVRPLCPTRSMIVAAPEYLQRAGVPQHPDELERHECVRFIMSDRLAPVPWQFAIDDRLERRPMSGRIDVSDPQAMVAAALAGLGLIQGPDLILRDHVNAGRLQQVLQDWDTEGPTICMVWPHHRYMSLRLRVFIEWLAQIANEFMQRSR
ncbi:MAG: LysR family transcriptional regulator [Steroidobacteraceae bacterium]